MKASASECRVIFKPTFQKKLLLLARERLMTVSRSNWKASLACILKRNISTIYDYLHERSCMSVKQLTELLKNVPLDDEEVETWIEDILPPTWGAAKGAAVTNRRYHERLSGWGRKGAKALREKYDHYIRSSWIAKAVKEGAKRSVPRQPLASTEKALLRVYNENGIPDKFKITTHENFEWEGDFCNIDFVFRRGKQIVAVEDVVGHIKTKASAFYRVIEAAYKKKLLWKLGYRRPFLLTFVSKRTPPDAIIQAGREGLISSLALGQSLDAHVKLLKSISDEHMVSKFVWKVNGICRRKIGKAKRTMEIAATREMNRSMNKSESDIHSLLVNNKLNPTGKLVVTSKYGTYAVFDNGLKIGDAKSYVSVCKTKRELRKPLQEHVGYAYMLKSAFDPGSAHFSVIFSQKANLPSGRAWTLCKKWIDVLCIGPNIEKMKVITFNDKFKYHFGGFKSGWRP